MIKSLQPAARLKGTIRVPPDKSLTHRALFLSSLSDGISTINNPLEAEDCLSTASCLEALGTRIDKRAGVWTVQGLGLWGYKRPAKDLNCGNSGTTMRLLSGILAAQDFSCRLTGDRSLVKRPMNRVAEPLQKMGAAITLTDGKFAPFTIHGTKKPTPIRWKNPVASAQVKSSVLLAALHANGETVYEEPALSRDHTERMLAACGVPIKTENNIIRITGVAKLKPQTWNIPGDPSSAAFFVVAGLLVQDTEIVLTAVNLNPTRTGFLRVLKSAGANIQIRNPTTVCGETSGDVIVKGCQSLNAFAINKSMAASLIDEVPILAIAATQAHGTSVIRGFEELRFKETDRLAALAKNLSAMRADVKEEKDGLIITGPTKLAGGLIDSFDDHRVAMSFAVASLVAAGSTKIQGSESVSISFPNFWDSLGQLVG